MNAHINVMNMGMNYADLAGEEIKEEVKSVPLTDDNGPFEYYEEDDEELSNDEEYEPCGYMEDEHKVTLKAWLADKSTFAKMKGLGRGFESGAKFVPIEGDGNCLFSSVSTALTFSREKPLGTPDLHN